MRRFVTRLTACLGLLLLPALLALSACKEEPGDVSGLPEPKSTASTADQAPPGQDKPPVVAPNQPMREAPEAKPAQTPIGFTASDTNAKHPEAGRSAFPEDAEQFDKPIPAKRLSQDDPFKTTIDPQNIPAVVPWNQAKKYIGHEITVEGKIVAIGRSRDGKVNFLNFDKDWRGKFYMVVFDDLAKTIKGGVDATFKNKLVRVKGVVEDHRGNPQIKILSMDQVEFVKP